MGKIVGNPTITPMAVPDWSQTNESKADFIKNKPTKLSEFENDIDNIPSIVYTELDNFTDGICKVTPISPDEYLVWDGEKFTTDYTIYPTSSMYCLCIANTIFGLESTDWKQCNQTLIFPNGYIYSRAKEDVYYYDYSVPEGYEPYKWYYGEWSKWKEYMPNVAWQAYRDSNNRQIVTTYATKEEFTDKYTWKLLGEATVTETNVTDAGEEGVTSIAIDCGYLGGYDELRINLQCGVNDANASLTNAQRHFYVGILNDVSEVIGQDDKLLIFNQGSTNGILNHTYINNLIINSYFTDGVLQYSEILNTNYSSHNYKTVPSVALPNHAYKLVDRADSHMYGHPIDLKNGNHIVVFRTGSGGFKFPAGTELKVYGR